MQFSVIVTLCLLGFFSLNSAEKSSSLRSDKSDKKRDSLATKVKDNRKGDIMRDMPMKLDPKGKGKGGKDFKMAPKGGMNSMKFEPRGKEFGKHAGKGKMKALDWERAPMNWKMSAKGHPKGGKEFGKHAGKEMKMKALEWERVPMERGPMERGPMNWKMSAKGHPKGGKEFGKHAGKEMKMKGPKGPKGLKPGPSPANSNIIEDEPLDDSIIYDSLSTEAEAEAEEDSEEESVPFKDLSDSEEEDMDYELQQMQELDSYQQDLYAEDFYAEDFYAEAYGN